MGNHITSWGLTRPTNRNHGCGLPARSRIHCAAEAAIGSSNSTPLPAWPQKAWSLPSQSPKPWDSMSG